MKILLISPYFPPFTGVGVLRPASLTDYLLKTGEDVTIFKLSDTCYSPEMVTGKRLSGPNYVEFMSGKTEQESTHHFRSALEDFLRDTSFDCCLITCGPFYTLLPALELTQRHHIPFIIDYRDLWRYSINPPTSLRGLLGRFWQRFSLRNIETALMEGCVAFVTCGPQELKLMKRHYPILQGKSACIYNGYNIPLQKKAASLPDGDEIRLFILGKFAYYTAKGAETFLRAAARLLHKGYPIRIIHAGAPETLTPLFHKAGFPLDYFEELGPLSYEDALAAAKAAQIGIIIDGCRYGLGTKLFDYICLNKPIAAVVPKNSEMEKLLSETENAFFCQTTSQLEAAMERIITENRWVLTDDADFRGRFSREEQNRRFHQLLLDAAEKGKGRG